MMELVVPATVARVRLLYCIAAGHDEMMNGRSRKSEFLAVSAVHLLTTQYTARIM